MLDSMEAVKNSEVIKIGTQNPWLEDTHGGMAGLNSKGAAWIEGDAVLAVQNPYGHVGATSTGFQGPLSEWLLALRRSESTEPTENLRQRLANANDYFRRKASEVLNDDLALRLLATLYQATIVDISELDTCQYGIALSKLTAANFCEVSTDVIYVTKSGRYFIDAIKNT